MGKEPFERIIEEHAATVLRACRAVVGVIDAEDAWSETFLSALIAYPQLPADANVQGWLVTIAHRKSIDLIRARNRRALPTDELPEGGSITGAISAIEAPGDYNVDLWDAVDRLPPKQRQAVAYHHVGGLPYAEVAELMGVSVAAARRSASDGVASLRRNSQLFDADIPSTRS